MPSVPTIHYTLSAPDPRTHYFHVQIYFEGDLEPDFRLALPVWSPGSYFIREYARHVINLKARTPDRGLMVARVDKAAWSLALPLDTKGLWIDYDVFSYELTVRSNYLDKDYGLVSPTATFMYQPELKDVPVRLTVVAPPGWDVATGLLQDGPVHEYQAANYDELVDAPIQLGGLYRYSFDVGGVVHEVVAAGPGADQLPQPSFLEDLSRIITTAKNLFGGLPYSHYVFLVTMTENGGGGLEHLNSANIMVPRHRWHNKKDYPKILSLFAHEFFHLWNVKRLHPLQLGPFDYQSEVYTSVLWVLEGFTDYFAYWLLGQSQVVPGNELLTHWAEALKQYEELPGRWVTPVADASREAWIRQYRPDSNTPNITVSYYLKGALVGLFLDLELRRHTRGQVNLAVIMAELWKRYGEQGYPEAAVEDLIVELGGSQMSEYLAHYVQGTASFDESVLNGVGLALMRDFKEDEGDRPLWPGVSVIDRNGRLFARYVERGGPAESGGLSPDDEIVALNGDRILTVDQWNASLKHLSLGEPTVMVVSHHGRLDALSLTPEPPRPDQYRLVAVDEPSDAQREAFHGWLGTQLPQ